MYEYIIETETPLSELKIFLTAKKLEPSARLVVRLGLGRIISVISECNLIMENCRDSIKAMGKWAKNQIQKSANLERAAGAMVAEW